MTKTFFISLIFLIIFISFLIPGVSAAHYIIGFVNNANDGTSANGHSIVLWNPSKGINDNKTDIIGETGNSGTDNLYMIDCELLNNSCKIGDTLNLKVHNNGDYHVSNNVSVTITGAGYDIAPNITLGSLFNITMVSVDDDITSPPNEIDLFTATNRTVTCSAIINDSEGVGIKNATARFFDNISSSFSQGDNGNLHYSNNSCYINSSYGINESLILCNFQVAYYANSTYWNCTMSITDNNNATKNGSSHSFINPLLSIQVNDTLDFGSFNGVGVSPEVVLNVTNYGNVKINLSLYGYGMYIDDGNAMNCSSAKNISIMYEKYNLTTTNPGNLNLGSFESKYINLTSNSVVNNFNLGFRTDNNFNIAIKSTYWRIYLPSGISGSCSGNIVFGASQLAGI